MPTGKSQKNIFQLIENNIMTLLSNVDPELVKKYFPDFITE